MENETILNQTALNNLKILLNLKKDNNIISHKTKLQIQNEYVQIDNTLELEYAIFFTFNQIFLSKFNETINQEILIENVNSAINHIYENKQLNDLMENDEQFNEIIQFIDSTYDIICENNKKYNSTFCEKLIPYLSDKLFSFYQFIMNQSYTFYKKNYQIYDNNDNNDLLNIQKIKSAIDIQKYYRRYKTIKDIKKSLHLN